MFPSSPESYHLSPSETPPETIAPSESLRDDFIMALNNPALYEPFFKSAPFRDFFAALPALPHRASLLELISHPSDRQEQQAAVNDFADLFELFHSPN